MQDLLGTFNSFMSDQDADTMFITGVAGTGKTTSLAELLEHCHNEDIDAVVCAYTHKACAVLREKLPPTADIRTLHSYLGKRPTINTQALNIAHVDSNAKTGETEHKAVIFVDEFSMVGEKDFMSLTELLTNEEGEIICKVVFIGDLNQLPPVKDQQTIRPHGDYWVKLTQIHRQAKDNPLIDNLIELNSYINGEFPEALREHDCLVRGIDIVEQYKNLNEASKVILAYTNVCVEQLNAQIEGKVLPDGGDEVYTPTLRKLYTMERKLSTGDDFAPSEVLSIQTIRGDTLELNSKFGTLETLFEIEGVTYYELVDENYNNEIRAVVFGHGKYQAIMGELSAEAVKMNKVIQSKYNMDPKEWAKANWQNPMAKARGTAWKRYLAFKDNVLCLDFKHAMTVHKSQGSTYDYVFLDTQDIYKCANRDFDMYLKLLYVGISRASKKVFTN